jgi:hypothetical protein
MTKTEVNEMLIATIQAKDEGFDQVSIDAYHLIELCNAALFGLDEGSD